MEGAGFRIQRDRDLIIMGAWTGAALERASEFPTLDSLLRTPQPPESRMQSPEEQERMAMQWHVLINAGQTETEQ